MASSFNLQRWFKEDLDIGRTSYFFNSDVRELWALYEVYGIDEYAYLNLLIAAWIEYTGSKLATK